jgi:hypothetical protein
MRHALKCKRIAEVARIFEDRGDATVVDAKELPQRRDCEVLMLRELLTRPASATCSWPAASAWLSPPCRHSDPLDQERKFSTEQHHS